MTKKLKKIGIAVIHGMGNQKKNFSDSFIQDIKSYYIDGDKNFKSSDLHFESIYWADILNDEENELWKNLQLSELKFDKLRNFVVNYFGDAIAYQKMYDLKKSLSRNDLSVYYKVQNKISDSLRSISENTEPDSPLVLISHSLGSVMLLNYIHDSQKTSKEKSDSGWSKNCDTDNLTGFFTCGSPFALWTLRKENFGEAISFPGKNVKNNFIKAAKWYNIYDHDDLLAFPLKNLNKSYKNLAALTDMQIEVDGLIIGKTPLSHLDYFTTLEVIKLISSYLRELSCIKN